VNAGYLVGREGDVRGVQEAALDALPIQVPTAAHVRDGSASNVIEEHLPVVVRVFREKVGLRVDHGVAGLSATTSSGGAAGADRMRVHSRFVCPAKFVFQEIAGRKNESAIFELLARGPEF
jgi:hypothetical protein